MTNSDLTPFRIDIPQPDVDDLHRRLADTRWPDELPDVGWDYGVACGHLRELVEHWHDGFDWRVHEARLNELPQWKTTIDGQGVHLAHVRSSQPGAVPLLITHGWPSTIADFLHIIGPLTEPAAHGAPDAPAFHLVAPSLPGFAFSGPTRDKGWSIARIAAAWVELMHRLGYDRYLVQGGDLGSLISAEVARLAPKRVAGVHLNAMVSSDVDWTSEDPTAGLTEAEIHTVYAAGATWEQRSGYATIQGTRPQTLAYALTDSPTGLLAWDLEWFVDYDPTTTTQTPIDRDAILTDVTITWLTGTAGSSARLYKDAGDAFSSRQPISGVPTAVAAFPGDHAIRTLAERSHHIVRWTQYDRGGHFPSLQAPDLFIKDLRAFATQLRHADPT